MPRRRVSVLTRIGIVLLVLSFVLQLLLFILSYAHYFSTLAKALDSFAFLSPFVDAMTVVTYISAGSCATQFLLIRLFSIQASGKIGSKYVYLIICLALTILDHWYLINALIQGTSLNTIDIARFAFGLVLTVLVLMALMFNSLFLGILGALGALARIAYLAWVIQNSLKLVSKPVIMGLISCEVLYGLGLAFCLLGIRKPSKQVDET